MLPHARAASASFRTRSIVGIRTTGGPAVREPFHRLRRIMESAHIFAQDGIYVNLYVPSRVSWKPGATRCSILQETDYPAGSGVTLTLTAAPPNDFTVYLRIPAWAGKGTTVSVNGHRVRSEVAPGFFPVRRKWKNGDKVELEKIGRAHV